MLAEDEALHVGQVHHRIHDGKAPLRELTRNLLDAAGLRKADADDGVGTALRKAARRLLTLRRVLNLELQVGLARGLAPALGALEGRLVEAAVELAAQLVDDAGWACAAGAQPTAAASATAASSALRIRTSPGTARPRCGAR
jgi:hypothetical protein